MGNEEEQKETMKALRHASGFLRHELAGRLTLRYMPELDFRLDKSIEKGAQVLDLIHQFELEEQQKPPEEQEAPVQEDEVR
jgi:ribosome-binding factor A